MRKHREYDGDDGRSIADMSGVERPRLFTAVPREISQKDGESDPSVKKERENPAALMPHSQRRAFIWGALSAALLIGLVFIAGLALVIFLITLMK